jgi:hypothetical protein
VHDQLLGGLVDQEEGRRARADDARRDVHDELDEARLRSRRQHGAGRDCYLNRLAQALNEVLFGQCAAKLPDLRGLLVDGPLGLG